MAEQLAFSLPAKAALGRSDFLVAPPNADAVRGIEGWQAWPGRKLVLTGPAGSGKTHLAHVWAAESGATILATDALAGVLGRPLAPEARIAIEDADRIDDPETELRLLGLHNLLQESGGWLLLTARRAPAQWRLSLPDLASRLQAAGLARLNEPDDTLLSGLLLKFFDDRQLAVDPAVVAYLASRIERSFAAAQAIVARIDQKALAQKRAITRPFVAEILGETGNPGD
ncbi:HdaA/DnaA family protein [Palleronia sp. KMU-117]|uniref:HdaA/DnaA family protein n=1 Tax=Palleronia sp. KMU-117 TaxID=3434108 RepID=UPI003D7029E2